jgi:hypothetical protein
MKPDNSARDQICSRADDTRIWATLQSVSGGTWSGCVFDADEIARVIAAGKRALSEGK